MSEVDAAADILTEVGLDDPVPCDVAPSESSLVTIGATVPTGFEFTAAAEVEEKLGCQCKISKDRGKIYFQIGMDGLAQVHRLRSVDNLFVIVQEFSDFPFKESKEAALEDFKELASKLPWEKALKTWELNNNLKKKKKKKKLEKERKQQVVPSAADAPEEDRKMKTDKEMVAPPVVQECNSLDHPVVDSSEASAEDLSPEASLEDSVVGGVGDTGNVLKFRVTCNRAGDKHSFTSNDAARDFGGAVQDHFQWKADMTNFDVEVLLNISYNEMLVGIALTRRACTAETLRTSGPPRCVPRWPTACSDCATWSRQMSSWIRCVGREPSL
ncbi:unnamed protein product [Staurois parvus]|uniref:THUMP domain-containing protein n=1 Tax=Staurois parvus TaxID=386267 RepID=A0ABN9HQ17_9NEOB|nr:unnamed protein product [Staurois parvus]